MQVQRSGGVHCAPALRHRWVLWWLKVCESLFQGELSGTLSFPDVYTGELRPLVCTTTSCCAASFFEVHLRKSATLLTDQPLCEHGVLHRDGLGFDAYASVLAAAARTAGSPFTIGIFGGWGVGKTSLMRLVDQSLAADDNVLRVWFNAWRYDQEEHPIVPLVAAILATIQEHKPFFEKLKGNARQIHNALWSIASNLSYKGEVPLGPVKLGASFNTRDVASTMRARNRKRGAAPWFERDVVNEQVVYHRSFAALSELRLPEDLRIVVFVDDLDRCLPDRALELLEALKTVFSQPGFVFVLGVARPVLEGYLKHRYATDYGLREFDSQSYLDKIVQLPFNIPPHRERMPQFVEAVLEPLGEQAPQELRRLLPLIGIALGCNPRAVIRFVNNILIDIAIAGALRVATNATKIPVSYFAISRCLQLGWESVFEALTGPSGLADDVASWSLDEASLLSESETTERESAKHVALRLSTDRELRELLAAPAGQDWLKNSSFRNASIDFLQTHRAATSSEPAATTVSQADVLVSYARHDEHSVVGVIKVLKTVRVAVRALPVGTSYEAQSAYFVGAKLALVCLGKDRGGSQRLGELLEFFKNRHLQSQARLLPVLLPSYSQDELPEALGNLERLDMRHSSWADDLRLLAERL